jgi:hypothetical protein
MELTLDSFLLTLALAGTGAYTTYMIKRRRDDIRKTIQVIELEDTEFWRDLTGLRDLARAKG